jgi:hypothetical protein
MVFPAQCTVARQGTKTQYAIPFQSVIPPRSLHSPLSRLLFPPHEPLPDLDAVMGITLRSEAAHSAPGRIQPKLYTEKKFGKLVTEVFICDVNNKVDECREEVMRNQAEDQNAKPECTSHGSAVGFLVAGLGIGAAVSVFLAPQSGAETRKWIATKCLDGVDAANVKVRQTRLRVHELVDEGQRKVTEAVIAGRAAFGNGKTEAKAGPS